MFNRRLMIVIALFISTIGVLWWYWQNPTGEALQAGRAVLSSSRLLQDFDGDWDRFSSLRQAWTTESEVAEGKNGQTLLTAGRSLTLPSNERFKVVAKRFQIPGEWSSRTMLLTFNGVSGHANVFLNGIDGSHKIGEFEGSGGADTVEIPAKSFLYGEDNILLVELAGSARQRTTFLGSSWPKSGQIKGDIRLEAVVDTTLMSPQVKVSWNKTTAQVTVKTNIVHHGFSREGPWTVYGVLSDGSSSVAEQTITVPSQEKVDHQPVTLTFTVPEVRRWTQEDPFRYQLHLTVSNTKGDIDDLSFPIGLRTMELSSGKWVLNDKVIPIKGEALTLREEHKLRNAGQIESWLKSKQQEGINLVYFIGQLPDELWLQVADELGMGLWAELPVELVPSNRLPKPDFFQKLIAEKELHPSLWAWTVGKGLGADAMSQMYFQQSEQAVQPNLAFALITNPAVSTGLSAEQSLYVERNKIQGSWGQVTVETPPVVSTRWVKEPVLARIWAVLMVFLAWMKIRAMTWRYKDIVVRKPKRRLRSAWLWDGFYVLAREGMLAGLITSGIFRIPIHFSPWFSHLWTGIELIQAQSPWLIWAMLSGVFMLVRLIQVGVAAPHLPEAPHTVGLVYWLERRYLFAVVIAIGWAALTWGVPYYVPIVGYIIFLILFLPIRIRDIHRIGGHYRSFLWVPGIIVGILLVWALFHYADWIFLWNILRS